MSRDEFLARVREATKAGRAYRVNVENVAPSAGYVGARRDDVCEAMAEEVDEVGGTAHLVADVASARAQVLKLLRHYQATSALVWQHATLNALDIAAALVEANVEMLDHDRLHAMSEHDARTAIMSADVGITSCDIAIAETGSLIVCSKAGQERVASLVTPVHIAVVKREQIVPDLFDAFKRLGEMELDEIPSNVSIITGPSKTGDIELTLTTGVHGPGKWHVIIVS